MEINTNVEGQRKNLQPNGGQLLQTLPLSLYVYLTNQ
jgi:hypothetical protein